MNRRTLPLSSMRFPPLLGCYRDQPMQKIYPWHCRYGEQLTNRHWIRGGLASSGLDIPSSPLASNLFNIWCWLAPTLDDRLGGLFIGHLWLALLSALPIGACVQEVRLFRHALSCQGPWKLMFVWFEMVMFGWGAGAPSHKFTFIRLYHDCGLLSPDVYLLMVWWCTRRVWAMVLGIVMSPYAEANRWFGGLWHAIIEITPRGDSKHNSQLWCAKPWP